MSLQQLLMFWPTGDLDKIPAGLTGSDADSLLSCWSALWHPRLLHATGHLPKRWTTANVLTEFENLLVGIPAPSELSADAAWRDNVRAGGAQIVDSQPSRADWVRGFLASLHDGLENWQDEMSHDFLALGYCFLQVESLTQKLQYSSTLDRGYFQQQAVAAAGDLISGERASARERLVKCFDALAQARDHYYPVEAFVVDLVLVAPTTLGAALIDELNSESAKSVLVAARTVEQMSLEAPAALEALREGLDAGRITLVGGEYQELPLPLCSLETILENLHRGLETYQRLLGQRPVVFGRRQYGLTPRLPQLLDKLGFVGALHATLDDGQFPRPEESKFYWEGIDGSTIESFGRVPVNASQPETFLYYADRLGDTMNLDHLATVCLAHWPGLGSMYCDDLRRIAQYVPVLGKLVTLADYFQDTDYAAHGGRFEPDKYRSPYLQQAVAAEPSSGAPISQWVSRNQNEIQQCGESITQALHTMLVSDNLASDASQSSAGAASAPLASAFESLYASLPSDTSRTSAGWLVWNPWGFGRRVCVEIGGQTPPAAQPPVYCTGNDLQRAQAIIELPAVGFAWLPHGSRTSAAPSRPLADNCVLRNEHMEVVIDPKQGTLQAIYDFSHRGNRLSQQLSWRDGQQKPKPYSVMEADRVAVTCASAALGEITCEGRLVGRRGDTQATFRQVYQLARGSRVLLVDVTLDNVSPLGDDPWESFLAIRFAWSEEAALLYRDLAWSRQVTEAARFEASSYVEIDASDGRTAILTGGLPFHRRTGLRHLDTLAIVRGEAKRDFRFGIGVDLTHTLHAAIGLAAPPVVLANQPGPPTPSATGWFFHADAKNVQLSSLQPLLDDGVVCGFRARLLETEGRRASCRLSFFRHVSQAKKTNYQNELIVECETDDGCILLEMSAHEWAQVEAKW